MDDSHLPFHLIELILARLPVRSLIRFKSVSKQWRRLINSKDFAQQQLIHQKSRRSKILIVTTLSARYFTTGVGTGPAMCIFMDSPPIEGNTVPSGCVVPYVPNEFLGVAKSCDGLVCLYGEKNIHVCNPSTRQFRVLPPASPHVPLVNTYPMVPPYHPGYHRYYVESWTTRVPLVGLGLDQVTKQYKVVRLFNSSPDMLMECEVLALNTNLWRRVGLVPYHIFRGQRPVYVRGALYWINDQMIHPDASAKIIAFDLHTDHFSCVSHPSFYDNPSTDNVPIDLLNVMDYLSLSAFQRSASRLDIWRMSWDEKTWEKMFAIDLTCLYEYMGVYPNSYIGPLAIHEDGSCWIVEYGVKVFAYYPDTKRFRRLLQVRPPPLSYIESLVSPYVK